MGNDNLAVQGICGIFPLGGTKEQGELVHPGKASGKNGLGGMLDIRAEPV